MAEPQGYSFDNANQADTQKFSFDTGALQLSAPHIGEQAAKYQFGLSGLLGDMTVQDVSSQLSKAGGEDQLRTNTAAALDSKRLQHLPKFMSTTSLTPEAYQNILKPTDKDTVLEDLYARKYMMQDPTDINSYGSFYHNIDKESEDFKLMNHMGRTLAAKGEVMRNELLARQSEYENQSLGGKAWNWGWENLVPYWYQYNMRGAAGAGFLNPFEGSALEDTVNEIWNKPLPEFKAAVKAALDQAASHDPKLALDLAQKLYSYSYSDKNMDNAFGLIDESVVAGGIKSMAKAPFRAMAIKSLRDRLKAAPDAHAGIPVRVAQADGAGDMATAAKYRATGEIADVIKGQPINLTEKILDQLPSAIRADEVKWKSNPGRGGQEIVNRLLSESKKNIDNLIERIKTASNVMRVPLLETSAKFVQNYIENVIAPKYKGWESQILNIDLLHEQATNSMFYETSFGDTDGKFFESRDQAQAHANRIKGLPITVEQQGDKFWLRLIRPVDETLGLIRNNLLEIPGAKTPMSIINRFATWLRNPDDTLPANDVMNRKIAAYTQSNFLQWAKDNASAIGKIRKAKVFGNTEWHDWEEVARVASILLDDEGKEGRFFQTPGEYEELFERINGYYPSEDLITAQFALQRHLEADRMFRILREATNRTRLGVENHGFTVMHEGQAVSSPRFDAVAVSEVPNNPESVVLMSDDIPMPDEGAATAADLKQTSEGMTAEQGRWEKAEKSLQSLKDSLSKVDDLKTETNPKVIRGKVVYIENLLQNIAKDVKSESNINPASPDKALSETLRKVRAVKRAMLNPQERKPIEAGKPETTPYTQPVLTKLSEIAKKQEEETGSIIHEISSLSKETGMGETELRELFAKEGLQVSAKGRVVLGKTFFGEERFDPFANTATRPHSHVVYSTIGDMETAINKLINETEKFRTEPEGMKIQVGNSKMGLRTTSRLGSKLRRAMKEMMDNGKGYLLRIYKPEDRPFAGFLGMGNDWVDYVWVKHLDVKELDLQGLVARRGGGHVDYDYPMYIKQPIITKDANLGRYRYEGDMTFSAATTAEEARHYIRGLERAKFLYKAEQFEEAKKTVHSLGLRWDQWENLFKETRDAQGNIHPPRFSLDEKFRVVESGKLIMDLDKDLARDERWFKGDKSILLDSTKRNSLARQYQVAYTGKRDAEDLMSYKNEGTVRNPVWKARPADRISPVPSMNRAFNRIVKTRIMEDYKISAMENWLAAASKYLRATDEDIRSSPFHYFFDAVNDNAWNVSKENADAIAQLRSNHFKIRQFTGIKNEWEYALDNIAQKVADQAYKRLGKKGGTLIDLIPDQARILPWWALGRVQQGASALRNFAFHAVMGLFSWVQFPVHLHTFVNIFSLSNDFASAGRGTTAAMLHGWSRLNKNPDVLTHMDRVAQHMGWRPGEFLEAMRELDKTSFLLEPGETAMADWATTPRLILNNGQEVLHAGTIFFRSAVKMLRTASWYTAYREFRDVHPTGAITRYDQMKILARADDLSHNMSRASSSTLHTGIMSYPAQFFSYFLRLTELFWSKRIGETPAIRGLKRAKMLAVSSLMFGFPTGLGIAGSPFESSIRAAFKEHLGFSDDSGYVYKTFMNGIESAMVALVTAEMNGDVTDPNKGTWLNFGGRYGPHGLDPLGQWWTGDKSLAELFQGAAKSVLWGTIQGASPMLHGIYSMITRDGKHQLTADDILDSVKEIRSVQNLRHWFQAVKYQHRLSNNEVQGEEQSKARATFELLTGVKSYEETEFFHNLKGYEAQEKAYRDMEFAAGKEINRALRAMDTGDMEEANRHWNNARNQLEGYPEEKLAKLYGSLIDKHRTNFNKIDDLFQKWMKHNLGPEKNEESRENYRKYEQSQRKRQGLE